MCTVFVQETIDLHIVEAVGALLVPPGSGAGARKIEGFVGALEEAVQAVEVVVGVVVGVAQAVVGLVEEAAPATRFGQRSRHRKQRAGQQQRERPWRTSY